VLVRATIDLPDMTFDESYNMREAVDFLTEKIGVREKLIQSARQFSEKNGSQKFGITVKRFEDLYADFLRLYQPLLEKISGHKEAIQREIDSQKDVLTGVLGMIQVARGVEVLADRVRELEAEAKGIETSIGEKEKTLARIDELLSRVKRQTSEAPRQPRQQEEEDIFSQPDDYSLGLRESATKPGSPRKAPSR
jgi:hypothetical protein